MGYALCPLVFLLLSCLANQLGSLRERFPLPKKPRCQRMLESFLLVIHTDLVAGSKMPSQCGLIVVLQDRPRSPSSFGAGGSEKMMGRELAYILLFSARRAPPLPPPPRERLFGAMKELIGTWSSLLMSVSYYQLIGHPVKQGVAPICR